MIDITPFHFRSGNASKKKEEEIETETATGTGKTDEVKEETNVLEKKEKK